MRLIDADELLNEINRLEQLDTETAESFTAGGGFRAIEFNRVKDYIDAAQTVSRGWIKTKDQLPKDMQTVVFITNKPNIYTGRDILGGQYMEYRVDGPDYTFKQFITSVGCRSIAFNVNEVDFWMPLPLSVRDV